MPSSMFRVTFGSNAPDSMLAFSSQAKPLINVHYWEKSFP
jgi:hypothetical protein